MRTSVLVLNFARLVERFLIIFSVVTVLLVTVLLLAWLLHLFARVYRKRGHQGGAALRQGSRPQVGTTYTQEIHKKNKQKYIPGGCRNPRLRGPAALLQQPRAEAAAARLPAPAPLLPPRPRPRPRSAGAGQQNCAALSNTSQASSRQASGESRLCTRAGGGENWWSFIRIYANHLIDTDNNMIIISAANRLIVDPTVSQREIGSATQKSKGTGGLVSIVSYSRPSLMIIVSRTQFHVERP